MRKWLYFLLIIVIAYALSQMGKKGKVRTPLLKSISETVSIIVWVLIIVYTVGFLYWIYSEFFKQ